MMRPRQRKRRLAATEDISPEDQEYVDEQQFRAAMDEVALETDASWSDLPLEKLRRAGEIGWDIDPDGPTGPEKFDNVYYKVVPQPFATMIAIQILNQTKISSNLSAPQDSYSSCPYRMAASPQGHLVVGLGHLDGVAHRIDILQTMQIQNSPNGSAGPNMSNVHHTSGSFQSEASCLHS